MTSTRVGGGASGAMTAPRDVAAARDAGARDDAGAGAKADDVAAAAREPVREVQFRSASIEEAHSIGEGIWYEHTLAPRRQTPEFTFAATSLDLGGMRLGTLHYSAPIRISTAPYVNWYQLNVPLRGTLRTAVGEQNVETTPTRAAVYGHDVDTAFAGFERPSVMLGVKFERAAVERAAVRLMCPDGQADGRPLPGFETAVDLAEGAGAAWLHLARRVMVAARRPEGLNPVLAEHLADRLIADFVTLCTRRGDGGLVPHAADLSGSALGAGALDVATDAIESARGAPLSLETLAALAGVSGRALQQAFRRAHGESPMAYQTRVRLERVRVELSDADPHAARVADIALRHGFAHLGRFAAQYAGAYGERPGDTLRRG
ncbi:MAG: AraC family transcriptional regulator [Pseudoclavibacter sp.]